MRLRLIGLALFVSALPFAPARIGAQEWRGGKARVEGSVKNEKGEPIAGAKVSLRWGKSGHGGPDLTTDKKGRWSFFGLVGGPWDIDFDAPGYLTKKISVELKEADRNPPIDVQLEPMPPQTHEELLAAGQNSKETAAAIEAGNTALNAKEYRQARENYLKALSEMPDSPLLLERIAAAYYGEDNTDEALKYAHRAIDKNPEDYQAWRLIAEIELQRGNLESGKAALAKVPEEKMTDAQPYLNIGIILLNKKKPAEAELAFGKAIAVKPDMAEAYYYRGLARLQQKHTAAAKADFRKNLELAPNGAEAKEVKELLKSIS
ncbi:MAG: tetratricopeptide repeat protein [Thermoanaerobaculia bacterium]